MESELPISLRVVLLFDFGQIRRVARDEFALVHPDSRAAVGPDSVVCRCVLLDPPAVDDNTLDPSQYRRGRGSSRMIEKMELCRSYYTSWSSPMVG